MSAAVTPVVRRFRIHFSASPLWETRRTLETRIFGILRNEYRKTGAFIAALGLFLMGVAACGGEGSPAASGGTQQVTSVPPTATPIPADSAVQSIEKTGLVVDSVELEPGSFGGSVQLQVTNTASSPCTGAVIMVSLLREDGSQAAEVGIRGHNIEPGESKSLKDRYFGTAVKAVISSATCEASSLGDSGAPGRAHTPVPGNEE